MMILLVLFGGAVAGAPLLYSVFIIPTSGLGMLRRSAKFVLLARSLSWLCLLEAWMDGRRGSDEGLIEQRQKVLAHFGDVALKASSLDAILTEACRLVGTALGTDFAKVMELQPDKKTLLIRAGVGWHEGIVGHQVVTAEEHSSEMHAILTGEP